jgi:pSer/pThr/pTyr-binding forkhead associated (FHA) protein
VVIGREVGNDVVLLDMIVSRRHAEVFSAAKRYYIRDIGSSNGITVNRSSIDQPYPLSHGDRILLGKTLIFFIDLQAGQETTSKYPSVEKFSSPPLPDVVIRTPSKTSPAAMGESTQLKVPTVVPQTTASAPVPVIRCTHCGVPNMPIARFCAGCSSLLHVS